VSGIVDQDIDAPELRDCRVDDFLAVRGVLNVAGHQDCPASGLFHCVSVPFLLHKLPFIQGITSARDMGDIVSSAIVRSVEQPNRLLLVEPDYERTNASPTDTSPTRVTEA